MTPEELKAELRKLSTIDEIKDYEKQKLKVNAICLNIISEIEETDVPDNIFEGFSQETKQSLIGAMLAGLMISLSQK